MLRIKSVHIQNFKTILDSGTVGLEEDITALIGQNESGKTNFLKALYSFNTDYTYDRGDLCSYNRRRLLNENERSEIPIIKLTCTGKITVGEGEALEEIEIDELIVAKYYDSHYEIHGVEPDGALEKYADAVRQEVIRTLVNDASSRLSDLKSRDIFNKETSNMDDDDIVGLEIKDSSDINSFEGLLREFDGLVHDLSTLGETVTDEDLSEDLLEIAEEVEKERNRAANAEGDFEKYDAKIVRKAFFTDIVSDNYDILSELPSFVFHENVDHLEDSIAIKELQDQPEKHRTFNNLIELTGLDVGELNEAKQGARLPLTNQASRTITSSIRESWTQEDISIQLDMDGPTLSVYVDDETGSINQPSDRSEGFKWFLSFYINFMAGTEGEFEDSIILLDDPGVYLHPSGQKDLLDTIESLTDTNQVIYNTHSPFLIDKDQLSRIRILEKEEGQSGTQITSEFHRNDNDVLAPIRGAFGASLSDSLFGNQKNILVEGYSDKIYLDEVSNYLRSRGKADYSLDPSKVSTINVGGADKMPYFAKFLKSEGYDYLILLDADTKGRNRKEQLVRDEEIDEENIVLLSDVISEFEGYEAEVEDLFDNSFYYDSVLDTYRTIFDEESLEDAKMDSVPTKSIAKKIGRQFGEAELGGLDKIKVAKEIRSQLQEPDCDDETIGEETMQNFKNIFSCLNNKLAE